MALGAALIVGAVLAALAILWGATYGVMKESPAVAVSALEVAMQTEDPHPPFGQFSAKAALEDSALSLPLKALQWNPDAQSAVVAGVGRQDYKVRARLQLAALALEQDLPPSERASLRVSLIYLATPRYHYAGAPALAWGFAAEPEAQPFILEALEGATEPGMKAAILAHLGDPKNAAAVPVIERLLANPDPPGLRKDLYRALGGIGGAPAFELLRKSLRAEADRDLHPEVLKALGRTRDPRAKAILTGYLEARDDADRAAAAEGLSALGAPAP